MKELLPVSPYIQLHWIEVTFLNITRVLASSELNRLSNHWMPSYDEVTKHCTEVVMLKTFKAWLRGSRLEWIGDVPDEEEKTLQVHVTFLNDNPVIEPKTRGIRMAEILEKLAGTQGLDDIDPVLWQQETRQERSLPGR